MSLLSYIIPVTVFRDQSPYNQDIHVQETASKYTLFVNGSKQSGPYIEKLWRKAFWKFKIPKIKPLNSVLVLGVAGGTVIKMLSRLFPQAQITGVDIDQKMINIGKTYFGLGKLRNLRLIQTDAVKFIEKELAAGHHYDLIIVDLFFGYEIPDFVTDDSFINKLGEIGTFILINYLRELEYKSKSQKFLEKLQKLFPGVLDLEYYNNRFFRLSRS